MTALMRPNPVRATLQAGGDEARILGLCAGARVGKARVSEALGPVAAAGLWRRRLWRRLSPSAELFIDPDTGARCVIRDTGATGAERYYWTVSVFGERQVAAGRTEELTEARSHAESALVAHIADWRDWPQT